MCLAPLAAPIAFAGLSLAFGKTSGGDCDSADFASILPPLCGVITVFSYVASAAFGVPLIRALRQRNRLSFRHVVMVGAAIGGAVLMTSSGLVLAVAYDPDTDRGVAVGILSFALYGAIMGSGVAACFCWLTGIPWRPD